MLALTVVPQAPLPQTTPQPPQLLGSLDGSTHLLPQHSWGALHTPQPAMSSASPPSSGPGVTPRSVPPSPSTAGPPIDSGSWTSRLAAITAVPPTAKLAPFSSTPVSV